MGTGKHRKKAKPNTEWSPDWSHEAIEAETALEASIHHLRRVFGRYKGRDCWADPLDDKPKSFTDKPAKLPVSAAQAKKK